MVKISHPTLNSLFHSLPSLFFLVFFAIGIVVSQIFGGYIPFKWIIVTTLILYLCLIFLVRKTTYNILYLFLLLFIFLGFIRGWIGLYHLTEEEKNLFRDDIVAFQGTVIDVDLRESTSNKYILNCQKVYTKTLTLSVNGDIVINQGRYRKRFEYGDVIRISGQLQLAPLPSNPGSFNYRKYLNLKKQFFIFTLQRDTEIKKIDTGKGNWIQRSVFNPIRRKISQTINRKLTRDAAKIVNALILGERGNLDKEIISDFQKTGVVHVLAISGLHVLVPKRISIYINISHKNKV